MNNNIGFTDQPATKDMFHIEKYISGLRSFISICQTPMTIAVQGDWGSGKTSVMNMVIDKLDKSRVFCVNFNAWQFSQFNSEEQLALSLITTVIDKIGASESEMGKVLTDSMKKYADGAIKAARMLATGVGDFFIGSNNTAEINSWINKYSASTDSISTLKEKFQKCVKDAAAEKQVDRILIFIDDLDRLQPLRAVELLEVLKIFLDCEKCVFVLAIDYNVVVSGVKSKYGVDITADKGRSFFDKIIQVPFKMPVAQYDISNFVRETLKNIAKIDCNENDVKNFVALINSSIGSNPRSMNRLFNSYLLLLQVMGSELAENDIAGRKTLFAILCMQQHLEYFYNYVVLNREELTAAFFNELASSDNPRDVLKNEGFIFTDDIDGISKSSKEIAALEEKSSIIEAVQIQVFIKCFNTAISANGNESIDEDCMARVKGLLKTSSVTATETHSAAPQKYATRSIVE